MQRWLVFLLIMYICFLFYGSFVEHFQEKDLEHAFLMALARQKQRWTIKELYHMNFPYHERFLGVDKNLDKTILREYIAFLWANELYRFRDLTPDLVDATFLSWNTIPTIVASPPEKNFFEDMEFVDEFLNGFSSQIGDFALITQTPTQVRAFNSSALYQIPRTPLQDYPLRREDLPLSSHCQRETDECQGINFVRQRVSRESVCTSAIPNFLNSS